MRGIPRDLSQHFLTSAGRKEACQEKLQAGDESMRGKELKYKDQLKPAEEVCLAAWSLPPRMGDESPDMC